MDVSLKDKLMAEENMAVDATTGCWNWLRGKNEDGYGYVWHQGKMHRASRASYEAFIGLIEGGLLVLHKCDNRACINPDHLFLGTHQDNAVDRNAKGRQVQGERHPNAKLTFAQVAEYRQLKQAISQERGERYSAKAARDALGLSKTITDHLDSGRRWKGLHNIS